MPLSARSGLPGQKLLCRQYVLARTARSAIFRPEKTGAPGTDRKVDVVGGAIRVADFHATFLQQTKPSTQQIFGGRKSRVVRVDSLGIERQGPMKVGAVA